MQSNSLGTIRPPVDFSPVSRLAPTPSGFLHVGNAFSFVLTWLLTKSYNGRLLLRIDDLDAARKRPEFVVDVFRSLDWLGLDFDFGPTGPDDFEANWSQRNRFELYQQRLHELSETSTLFPCQCTRRTIQNDNSDGQHPASCRAQNVGRPLNESNVAWRIATPIATTSWRDFDGHERRVTLHDVMRDFVVRRRDGVVAYQIASLVDDEHFKINLVVRGNDLVDSTAAQRWLATQTPGGNFNACHFLHHDVLTNDDGLKLSKSASASSLRAMREAGTSANALFAQFSPLLGFAATARSASEALTLWNEAHAC